MNTINLSIDPNNPESSFKRIAEKLLNHNVLVCGENTYRICEIEFYFKADFHDDSYTHCHEQQKTSGKWYQHGSGLDITIGNREACGGILIRAIQKIDDNGDDILDGYTYGPLKTLQALMASFKSIAKHQVTFGLEEFEFANKQRVLSAQRVGLNPNLNPDMHKKMYRFFIYPKKRHDLKGEIITNLSGILEDDELKELFGWKTLPKKV